MKILSLFLLFALAGCASTFRKYEPGAKEGYQLIELGGKAYFQIHTILEEGSNSVYVGRYQLRAIGEECATRGYEYFNYDSSLPPGYINGFCYRTPTRKMVGITFHLPKNVPGKLVVERTDGKPGTKLQPGDQVTKVNGVAVTTIDQLKIKTFEAEEKGASQISVEFLRDGNTNATLEPLIEFTEANLNKNFDREYLDVLRREL